ncbi:hypothetical protein [Bordetella genomosp. 1]|uniref:hypothetical protein n=1 Tax=Bordetella genomosp. 1 TaxID=1395607 RepID=UPI00117815D7|nr:hypothetical protein [Bordetella genomosp. 1]
MAEKSVCTRAWNNACALAGAKRRAAGETVPAGANLAVLVHNIAKRCCLAERSHCARGEFVAAYLTARSAARWRRHARQMRCAARCSGLLHACSNVLHRGLSE